MVNTSNSGFSVTKRILITGADGFIGQPLTRYLRSFNYEVNGSSRLSVADPYIFAIGDLAAFDNWGPLLQKVDTVVHLAGLAHKSAKSMNAMRDQMMAVNCDATKRLAHSAMLAGVRRFIFFSSIGVFGHEANTDTITEQTPVSPTEVYALSKHEAELALREILCHSETELVVIRPPLVHGPRVKGNFLRLLKLIDSGVPIPIGAFENRRSFVGVQNLCSLVRTCIDNPKAAGEVFVVADDEVVSTAELLMALAKGMQRKVWLPSVPPLVVKMAAALLGKADEIEKMCQSLVVDASKAKQQLNWTPGVTLHEGLNGMANWFRRAGLR